MRDLTVNYAGLRLPTPLLVAAAGISERVELMKRAQDYGAGGVVMKSLFEEEVTRRFPTPCFRVIQRRVGPLRSSTLYSFEQASSWNLERYCEEIARAKRELDIPVIASINCVTDEGWTSYATAIEEAGADALELNRSCPYSTQVMGDLDVWGQAAAETVRLVKSRVSIPVIAKFTPQLTNPMATAVLLERAGADGLCMFSRFTGLEIDVEKERAIMHGGFAGHGGLWAIHYALRWIVVTAPAVRIPISASGGVGSGEDVVKYLLVGANNVQVCTAIYVEGFEALRRIKAELEDFMARKGYEKLDDFRGKVCGTVLPMEKVDRSFKVVAAIEAEKCTGCGLCQRICIFDGPQPQGSKYVIGPDCRGCGLCVELCPPRAIALVPRRGGD